MKTIKNDTLKNIINSIDQFSEEMVLFVRKEWGINSDSYVYDFEDDEEVPMKINDEYYFLEVAAVNDVIDVWNSWTSGNQASIEQVVAAVIHYAVNDAYKSAE